MPSVSIIIPAYNVEKYLAEAVRSVLAQTYTNLELIIVNDSSTDSTGTIADTLAQDDARIRVIHNQSNKLRSGALNTGIQEAKGSYIGFLDADDLYKSDKIEKQMAYLGVHPNIDMVYGDFEILCEDQPKPMRIDSIEFTQDILGKLRNAENKTEITLAENTHHAIFGEKYIPSCSPLIRREVFDIVAFDESLANSEDYDLWLQIIGAGFQLARIPFVTYT